MTLWGNKITAAAVGGLTLVSVALGLVGQAAAATPTEGLNLTTSPLPVSLTTKPGTTITTNLRVRNSGTQVETLKVNLMKFSAYGEAGQPLLSDRGPADSYFDWVTFSPATFTAAPNIWQTVTMTIKVPATGAFGYYYAVTFARANAPIVTPGQRQTAVQGAAATLVLLDVDVPGAKRQVDVDSFSVDHSMYEFLPTSFSIRLRNSGNVHVAPAGNIFITRGGKDVAQIPINQDGGNILPGSNRVFTASWTDGFPAYISKTNGTATVLDSHGKVETQLSWDLGNIKHLRYGHYTAHLLLAYDNGTRDVPIEATVSFWVIPWRLIFGALLLLAIPAVADNLLMRWRTKRKAARS